MGLSSALDEVYPDTRHQSCRLQKTANILNKLPKSLQPEVKQSLHDIWQADTRKNAEKAFDFFARTYEARYSKAVQCLQKDGDTLISFYDYPAQHGQSIRSSNPIESTFGTIPYRTRRAKGCLSRDGMLHMIFKLRMCAETRWTKLRGFNYLVKEIEGRQF